MISLQKEEYLYRRQKMLTKMHSKSAALFFSAPEVIRSNSSKYPFRQNSNFWYFTGFNESEALLMLIKYTDIYHQTILFNCSRNTTTETWFGRRLGQEAALEKLGVDQALAFDDIDKKLYHFLNGLDIIYHAYGEYKYADKIVFFALNKLRKGRKENLTAPFSLTDWRPIVSEMRLFKSEKEINIIRHAAKISAIAHTKAMKKCKVGMFEYQLEGEIQYEFCHYGARYPSYNIIVGGGKNSCILHYTENTSKLRDGDLVLVDAGCEYQGYASDISRTFPINGRFTPAQRAIYDIVLTSLETALILFRPETSIREVTEAVVQIMVRELVKLGLLHGSVEKLIEKNDYRIFFMHSLSHWLGLDVHDTGDYGTDFSRKLKPGIVLTVEPGLYISLNANVPVEFRGIGVRIEENIVITKTGNENLTSSVVKHREEIENTMAEK